MYLTILIEKWFPFIYFFQLNPLHTIPVINDNGFVVYDRYKFWNCYNRSHNSSAHSSNAIMKYLVDQYARDDTFYPKDPKRGAIVTQRNFFIATHLFSRFGDYFVCIEKQECYGCLGYFF